MDKYKKSSDMENEIKELMDRFDEGNMSINDLERDLMVLYNFRNIASKKGTVWYIILITTLCGLLAGICWRHSGFEVGIFILLLLIVMFLASIRYNQ